MNGADSEPGRQLPTTAARENECNATQVTSVCVEDGGLLEIVFFYFVGYQFLTDFDSQNQCLCSRRSHGPLLCAFCLCFHYNNFMKFSILLFFYNHKFALTDSCNYLVTVVYIVKNGSR